MIFLAALLSWGWPTTRVVWVPYGTPTPPGLTRYGPIPSTGSMRPMISGGEYYFAETFAGQQVYPGDLVGLVTWYGSVLHEVTAVSRDAVMTSGRANRHSDGWTDKSAILFIVRNIERKNSCGYKK